MEDEAEKKGIEAKDDEQKAVKDIDAAMQEASLINLDELEVMFSSYCCFFVLFVKLINEDNGREESFCILPTVSDWGEYNNGKQEIELKFSLLNLNIIGNDIFMLDFIIS